MAATTRMTHGISVQHMGQYATIVVIKPNHWAKVCRLTKQRRSGDRQQKRQFRPQHQSMTRRGHNGRQKGTVHSISGQSTKCMDEHFQHMSFTETEISSVDTRDEVFATH